MVRVRTPISSAAPAELGISLLEIIIVLAILALVSSLGVGATISWLERGRAQEAGALLRTSLHNARFSALLYSDSFAFDAEQRAYTGQVSGVTVPLDPPGDWVIHAGEAPLFTPEGCSQGRIALQRGDRVVAFGVTASDCAIVPAAQMP